MNNNSTDECHPANVTFYHHGYLYVYSELASSEEEGMYLFKYFSLRARLTGKHTDVLEKSNKTTSGLNP